MHLKINILKRLQLSFGVTEVSILYVCKFKLLLVNPNYHLVLGCKCSLKQHTPFYSRKHILQIFSIFLECLEAGLLNISCSSRCDRIREYQSNAFGHTFPLKADLDVQQIDSCAAFCLSIRVSCLKLIENTIVDVNVSQITV